MGFLGRVAKASSSLAEDAPFDALAPLPAGEPAAGSFGGISVLGGAKKFCWGTSATGVAGSGSEVGNGALVVCVDRDKTADLPQ